MVKDPNIKSPKIPLITAIFIVIANMIGTGVFTILGFQVQALNSVFAIVALWHAAFNSATATTAGAGAPAAVASTLVMMAAVVILVAGWRHSGSRQPTSV